MNKTQKLLIEEAQYGFYEQVSKEIQAGKRDEGVWAKAYSLASGDEKKTKAVYIDLMVEKLMLQYESKLELEKLEEINQEKELKKKHKKERKRREDKAFESFVESKIGCSLLILLVVASGVYPYSQQSDPVEWGKVFGGFIVLFFSGLFFWGLIAKISGIFKK